MNGATVSSTRITEYITRATSGLPRRNAFLIVGLLSAAFLWVIPVTPTVVAFVLTVG
jgi:hypothetical protein